MIFSWRVYLVAKCVAIISQDCVFLTANKGLVTKTKIGNALDHSLESTAQVKQIYSITLCNYIPIKYLQYTD